jgi:CRP-like cAMP-binding protein/Fe-S-cluster-containing hydrogenase component 2
MSEVPAASPLKTIVVKPEVALELGPRDMLLDSTELTQLELFSQLKKPISVEKFPGSIVLRNFQPGDVICRQGEAGSSAFYITKSDDLTAVFSRPLAAPADQVTQPVATAHILAGSTTRARSRSWWQKILPLSKSSNVEAAVPDFIPNDGPSDIDYQTRQADMFEGDVFGEMSCMTHSPRSATVVAARECWMVEFQRNIFDQMQKDAGYRDLVDEIYRQRVLSTHLKKLAFFRDVDDALLAQVRESASLHVHDPGDVICDEQDVSDSVYIVRSGIVQVATGVSAFLKTSLINDWQALASSLIPRSIGPAPDDNPTDTSSSPASPVDDILAAARGGGDKKETPAEEAPKPASPVDDILAAARGGGDKKETPAEEAPKPASAVDDILAAARGGDSESVVVDPEPTEAKDVPAEPGTAGGSAVDDILSAARGSSAESRPSKSRPASAVKSAKSRSTSGPSAEDILAMAAGGSPAETKTENGTSEADDDDESLVSAPSASSDGIEEEIWNWLRPSVQQATTRMAKGEIASEDQDLLVGALNQLVKQRALVSSKSMAEVLQRPEVLPQVTSFPKGIKGAAKDWSELEVRIGNYTALRSIYSGQLPGRQRRSGPPRILGYLARGECFGEMGVLADEPRTASCIAYDHPNDDPGRRPGRVELVRIDATVFRSLLESSPALASRVDALVLERRAELDEQTSIGEFNSWDATPEFRDSGLIQGQNLLLIDLDSCTRCGDCVRACVESHDDGYSRLFLDGPRFDRFLVPSACRQCLNPSCMIGCPVGSIQRGANGQIEIRDWCIGCSLCARQCPYDSIQMHDVGLISENSIGWHYAPASAVGSGNWQSTSQNGRGWQAGNSPFRWTIDLQQSLVESSPDHWQPGSAELAEPIYFKHQIKLESEQLLQTGRIRLHITAQQTVARVWINGAEVELQQDAKQKKKGEFEAELQAMGLLRAGTNTLALELRAPDDASQAPRLADGLTLLSVRLDPVPEMGAITAATADGLVQPSVELVTERAVVCDLCSSLASQQPACVTHCPHDAAMRVDARQYFPTHN